MEIGSTISAIAGTVGLVTKAIEARDNIKLAELKIALFEQMLKLQGECFDMSQTIQALQNDKAALAESESQIKAELHRLLDHRTDIAENFVLHPTGNGGAVYRNKAAEYGHMDSISLCANCVTAGQKTHLQPTKIFRVFKCPNGHGEIMI